MEKEWLKILSSFVTSIAVTHMTNCDISFQLFDLSLVEDLSHKAVTLDTMELTVRIHCHNTAALLTSVLQCMKAIISKACCILHAIDTEHTMAPMESLSLVDGRGSVGMQK